MLLTFRLALLRSSSPSLSVELVGDNRFAMLTKQSVNCDVGTGRLSWMCVIGTLYVF